MTRPVVDPREIARVAVEKARAQLAEHAERKGNPYKDKEGKFTSKENAVPPKSGGDAADSDKAKETVSKVPDPAKAKGGEELDSDKVKETMPKFPDPAKAEGGQHDSAQGYGYDELAGAPPAGLDNIGKTGADMVAAHGWPAEFNGVDITGQQIRTRFDTPEVLAAEARSQSEGHSLHLPNRGPIQDAAVEKTWAESTEGAENGIGQDRIAHIVTGGPGAGKSVAVANLLVRDGRARLVDSDEVKKHIPEFNGNNATFVHEESSMLNETRIFSRALARGDNVVLPKVGHNPESIRKLVGQLEAAGYTTHFHYVDVAEAEQVNRVMGRYRSKGRFVNLNYVVNVVDGKPLSAYHAMKDDATWGGVAFYNNNVPMGTPPIKTVYRAMGVAARLTVRTEKGGEVVKKEKFDLDFEHALSAHIEAKFPAPEAGESDRDIDAMAAETLEFMREYYKDSPKSPWNQPPAGDAEVPAP